MSNVKFSISKTSSYNLISSVKPLKSSVSNFLYSFFIFINLLLLVYAFNQKPKDERNSSERIKKHGHLGYYRRIELRNEYFGKSINLKPAASDYQQNA